MTCRCDNSIVALVVTLVGFFPPDGVRAQTCVELVAATAGPQTEIDNISTTITNGAAYGWKYASLDETGRVFLLQDPRHPEEAKTADLDARLFPQWLALAREAADTDRERPSAERKQFDTTTLEGLLEAAREGQRSAQCKPGPDGLQRKVEGYVEGERIYHSCVDGNLAEYSEALWTFVSGHIEESGEYLCQ